ncbi:hypothetical protein GLOTRDRAFT_124543 [Gloeophyllum trabeum ATCC 11539]|uniref:Uncharacterized protein n=1 Tax=Gloeophyllum trabeum (strain ATCC 11539 / FP-39264 / Madison 617) TaxID=670483 RepID=S7QMT4_GLOTA|nr:uncharacterized protein GLOTRDRAFT_124543 [Gloeophyllum trabeum ATCC 11539]EPQ60793.1 hypothetical protein GLOTRDRAFT_124543 [Gloeophyllum trabeum ATCC 11539]
MPAPAPLPAHAVSLVLQYIAPPSGIAQPLPPHLLSRPLLQRHHFLAISPDDPKEYLSWPSSAPDVRARALALLEDLPSVDPEDALYPVQYTSDAESTYAHVHIPSLLPSSGDDDLRLVFHWGGDEWKYHDAALMPFPPNSSPDLESPVAASLPVPQYLPSDENVRGGADATPGQESDDDDDYWNSYGGGDDDGDEERDTHHSRNAAPASDPDQSEEDAAEAAYWAQYSSVHGTADSTIPSPLPEQRRQMAHPNPYAAGGQESQIVEFPPRDIPSPHHLSNLLRHASPRQSFSEPYSIPGSPPPESNGVAREDGDEGTSDGGSEDTKVLSPKPQALEERATFDSKTGVEDAVDAALKASITGMYQLWRSSKPGSAYVEQERKEDFMRVIREVVMGLP